MKNAVPLCLLPITQNIITRVNWSRPAPVHSGDLFLSLMRLGSLRPSHHAGTPIQWLCVRRQRSRCHIPGNQGYLQSCTRQRQCGTAACRSCSDDDGIKLLLYRSYVLCLPSADNEFTTNVQARSCLLARLMQPSDGPLLPAHRHTCVSMVDCWPPRLPTNTMRPSGLHASILS